MSDGSHTMRFSTPEEALEEAAATLRAAGWLVVSPRALAFREAVASGDAPLRVVWSADPHEAMLYPERFATDDTGQLRRLTDG